MLKPGYKQTDLGVLPEEWEVKPLKEVLKETRLGGNYANSIAPTPHPLIKMGNLGRGSINLNKLEFVKAGGAVESKHRLKYGALLFNTRNTLDLVGKVAIWKDELTTAYYNSNILQLIFDEKQVPSTFFVNYVMNTEQAVAQMRGLATGTTSVAAVYTRDLLEFQIPVPSPAEQKAIADALNSVEALITAQRELLAKKRALKLATQQALLSGERRLPGFAGESEFETLGELILSKPAKAASEGKNELISFVGMEDVSEHGQLLASRQLSIQEVNKGLTYFERNDVLVAKITPCFENGKGAHVDTLKTRKGFGSTEFHVLRANENAIAKYIFYHTQSGDFRRKLEGEMIGTAGQKRVPITAILDYMLPFGHSKAEQCAIAAILSDMDAELEALAAQLAKTQALKQGLMQDLLTGTIRLAAGAAPTPSHPTP